jgi:hypothetical protein
MLFMKRHLTLLYIAALITIIPLILLKNTAAGSQTESAVLGVQEFMKNVDRYQGQVRLEGVVSAVSPADQALSLIDIQEFKDCGVTTCAPLTLPVKWQGPLPSVRDVVQLEGEVRESGGKLFFEAQRLLKKASK